MSSTELVMTKRVEEWRYAEPVVAQALEPLDDLREKVGGYLRWQGGQHPQRVQVGLRAFRGLVP